MESFNNYSFRGYDFTIWFFRILLSIICICIVLLFALKINETVTIRSGEIVAANPQNDFKAPFDAQIEKIYIREGQPVKAGDTLLTIRNGEHMEQYARTNAEMNYLQQKIASFGVLQQAIKRKKEAIEQTRAIAASKYQLDINNLINNMKSLDEQYTYQKERLYSADEKFRGDSILLQKDMLSKYEFNNTKDANLALRENLSAVQAQRNKQIADKNLVYNNFTREQNGLLLSKVQLTENEQALLQAKSDYEKQLIQAKEAMNRLKAELGKQNIIATTSGIVNFLFSTKQTSNLITKGDLLVSIAPQTVAYYAKLMLPEKEMPYIKAGQKTILKIDAYQKLQRGLINGTVSYVAERKEADNFYALVTLYDTKQFQLKSGYSIYGEIVIQRMPLYQYFIKKLFKKFDQI